METIKLYANASNWSEVTNIYNYGKTFIAPNGKVFTLIKHKRAHYDEDGTYRSGAQATVTINIDGKIQTYATPQLKKICGVERETKGGYSLSNRSKVTNYTPAQMQYSRNNTVNEVLDNKYEAIKKTPINFDQHQIIYYGCPGSGKSYKVNELLKQESFNEYLLAQGLADTSCVKYANVLTLRWVIDIAKKDNNNITTLYDVNDINLINKILSNPVFVRNNEIGKNMYSNALKHYIEYIKFKDTKKVFRTTFHSDTDYASFVGCYKPHTQASGDLKKQLVLDYDGLVEKFKEYLEVKPTNITKACTLFGYDYYESIVKMQEDNVHTIPMLVAEAYKDGSTYDSQVRAGMSVYETSTPVKSSEKSIVYEFCPQVFTNAYVQAWQNLDRPVYLIIEEINRGNCAQIFGDLFQLLDRGDNGFSEYPIKADKDLADYLKGVLGAEHEGIKDGKLCLPPNLIIYATMNTSDQSLFPMDSAFKRRWDWEYVPIEYGADKKSYNFIITIGDKEYRWVEFLKIVNEKIYDATNSEDKQMGNFFIKKSIDAATFVNKVMFYLWNEVCKEEYGTQRNFFRKGKEGKDEFKFTELFGSNRDTILNEFMSSLNVPTLNKEPENTEA